MEKRLIRLAYAVEFLVAVIAVFTLWSEVAGQAHIDLIYWYWKLGLGLGVAFAIVKATSAAVEDERAWNGRTRRWFAVAVVLLVVCGMVTYYGHLYYEDEGEEEDQEESAYAAAVWIRPASLPR